MKNVLRLYAALALVAMTSCATSSHIMVGTARKPIDSSVVRVYTVAPANSEQIALLNVESSGWTEQGEKDLAVSKLKKEAASLGANGVLLLEVGTDSSGVVGTVNPQSGVLVAGQSTYTTLRASAIFVPAE